MALIDCVFPKLLSPKTWLDKCLKSSVSEAPTTSTMVNGPKYCQNLIHSTLTAKEIELEKVSLTDMANLGSAC